MPRKPRHNKRAQRIGQSYRRLYPGATKRVRRTVLSFVRKPARRKKLIDRFLKLFKPTIKIKKADPEAAWIASVADEFGGDISMNPVMVEFVHQGAAAVLDAMGEALSVFDFAGTSDAFLATHGLELATTVAESMKPALLGALREGIALNEHPYQLKERLRGALGDWEEYRLNRLARTESMRAVNAGVNGAIMESGVVTHKEWIENANACPICITNALDGAIPKDAAFSGGEYYPPQHPSCRCSLGPVVKRK